MRGAIIGLGNPGEEYEGTYHNVGAAFVAWIAGEDASWTSRDRVRYAVRDGVAYALTTGFMNESGRGVRELADFLRIPPANVVVAHDDTDQLLGNARLRRGGGDGGHNGVASVIATLGTDGFWRLKIGARPEAYAGSPHIKAGGFVLNRLTEADRETLYGAVFPAAAKLASNVIENEMPSGPERISATGSSTRASDGSDSSERLKESS